MNIGDTFTHNGIEYTVVSKPTADSVKGRGLKSINAETSVPIYITILVSEIV